MMLLIITHLKRSIYTLQFGKSLKILQTWWRRGEFNMNKLMPLICIYVFAKFELKSSSSAMRFKKHNQVMFYQTNNSNIFNSLTLSLALERKSFIESQTIIHFVRVEAIRWHFFHHTMRRRWRDLTTKFCINFILSSLSLSLTHSLVLCYLLNLNLFFRFFFNNLFFRKFPSTHSTW